MDNVIPVNKRITWPLLSRLQGNKPHRNSPELEPCPLEPTPSEPSLRNLHQHVPELSGTPEPSKTFCNQPFGTFRNTTSGIYAGILRNLPEPASGTYTSTRRNSPEPSGTRLRNLHQHTPILSGTFRNLLPEPAPASHTGAHRSLSGLKTQLAYAVGELKKKKTKKNRRAAVHRSRTDCSTEM